jgi:uncharacterized membrane protein
MKSSVILSLAIAMVTITTMQVFAESKFERTHPRRDQVNDRLANENKRINQEVKEGEMTSQQGRKLHRQDRQIRQEERDMAGQNGGHITKSEQGVLNQQENAVSRRIGQ